VKFLPGIPDLPTGTLLKWSNDGSSLMYVRAENGVSNIWAQQVDGGIPRQITQFKEEDVFGFAPSPDGGSLAVLRGHKISDVVVLHLKTD
jgi:hypothetical protein